MGTTSGPQFLSEDGLPFGMPSGASPALHPSTPFGNTPVLQTTVEAELLAQMTSLRKEMARLQEQNKQLTSKVDRTQRQLNEQDTQDIQTAESTQSLPTPSGKKKGKKRGKATPGPSKQLVVPAPQDQPHLPKKVYTDCRHRINDKQTERHRSPIRINANRKDARTRVLGSKSPIRRVQGLASGSGPDNEYIPSGSTESSYRSVTPTKSSKVRPPSPRRPSEDYSSVEVPSRDPAIRLLFQKIQKMEDDRTRSQEPVWGKLRPGPFTERIKRSQQERDIQPLRIPYYTGTQDPLTHLHSFQSAVGCKGLSDEGQCLLFPSSLSEAALNWFYRLEPGTVDSFDELKQIFLNHFMIQTDRLYSADDLYTIRQGDDEPLREYAARFSHEYSRCPETDDRAAYGAFKSGLRSSHFRYLVHSHKRKDNHDDRRGNSKKGRGKYGRNEHRAPLPNLMNEHEQIPKPTNRKPNRQDNRDTGKFCRYHQQNSHNTEDCISLRKIVERLIREGKLDQYIARPQQAPAPNANRQINMISTISGGPTLAGPSNRSVKQYVRAAHYPQVFGIESDRHRKFTKVGWEPITFSEEEEEGIIYPHDDPMIIRAEIADYDVGRVLIDTGSSVNVIFTDAFRGLGIADSMVNRQITPLLSFSGDLVQPVGSISLPIAFGVAPRKTMTYDQFLIVDCPTAYNVIIGRTALTRVKAHLSPHMLLMKFPTCNGTGSVRGDQLSARTCYATALKSVATKTPVEAVAVQGLPNGSQPIDDPREESPTPLAQPAEELETIVLNEEHPDRCVMIGTALDPNLRGLFIDFLRQHAEVFAWSYDDMPGISPDVICHKLSISPTCKPVRQKRRSYDAERYEAMRNEVDKLKAIGFVREATYPVWLANSVMVRKAKGGWRMCQDYTDLNKACPKDNFPLPRIDQLVDATAGHELLSFMDAYSGYNQIFMDPADSEHTAFITDRGLYCYNVMPFGLKNAGATYQRLVNRIFAQHIGSIMEVYVDDMLVKSRTAEGHLENLALMFRKANPEKIKAIIDMETPKTQKDIQSLTGRVAAFTRFISKATDKCVPFFKALKGGKHQIAWTPECDQAFQNLKNYMSKAPLLSKPLPGEVLLLYLSVSVTAVSSVLIRKPEKAELPIFYVSKALQSAELRYPPLEQLALALVTSARRLRPYFQAHQITDQSASSAGEFDIQFKPRPAEKGQVIADFISELTLPTPSERTTTEPMSPVTEEGSAERFDPSVPVWILHVDGSANQQGCGAGLVLTTPDGGKLEYAIRFSFRTSNNEAEYEALLAGLRLAKSMSAKQISIHSDSQLIVNQITADFAAKDASMSAYLSAAHQLLGKFQAYEIRQIPRSENSHADALSRLASAINDKIGRKVPVEILSRPSTTATEVCTVRYENTWMSPIYAFLVDGTLPTDKSQARKLRYRSARYTIINDVLYKRGYSTPYLKCLTKEQGDYILQEVHGGVCGDHSGSRSLAHKVFRQGYFWPTLHQDASVFVRKCDKCQRFGNIPHIPAEPLSPIVRPWPFAQWGLDLIGPMPEGKGQVKYAVVAVDYFTKWVEAKALATITAARVEDFVRTNICCRFGIPYAIITDNGRPFDSELFRGFCSRLKINLFFASPAHPQSNGQVEAMNKIIKKLLKRQLEKAKGAWPEKLPEALWAIRTSYRTATGETPFSMAFGSEAVVPVEISEPSYRTETFAPRANEEALALSLDLIEERRAQANLRNEAYKQRISRYYDSRVKPRSFRIGDWVMREVSLATKNPTEGTLGPSWEGPYEIIGIRRSGTYRLRDSNGKTLGNPWNVEHLKYYYK
ncbi:unnamed protein product [Prunus brigantina]